METYKLVISGRSLLISGGIILGIHFFGKYQYYKGRVDKANEMKKKLYYYREHYRRDEED